MTEWRQQAGLTEDALKNRISELEGQVQARQSVITREFESIRSRALARGDPEPTALPSLQGQAGSPALAGAQASSSSEDYQTPTAPRRSELSLSNWEGSSEEIPFTGTEHMNVAQVRNYLEKRETDIKVAHRSKTAPASDLTFLTILRYEGIMLISSLAYISVRGTHLNPAEIEEIEALMARIEKHLLIDLREMYLTQRNKVSCRQIQVTEDRSREYLRGQCCWKASSIDRANPYLDDTIWKNFWLAAYSEEA